MEGCIEDTSSGLGNVVWIGAKKRKQKWYEVDESGRYGNHLNYTNVLHSGSTPTSDCAYLQSDGAWLDASNVCKKVSLCTICLIKDEPIFTIKGVCSLGEIDWNYYIDINTENHELNMYEIVLTSPNDDDVSPLAEMLTKFAPFLPS